MIISEFDSSEEKKSRSWSTSSLDTSSHMAWQRVIMFSDGVLRNFEQNSLQMLGCIVNNVGSLESLYRNVPNVLYEREIRGLSSVRKCRASSKTILSNTRGARPGGIVLKNMS
ncbi:hypothetical protein TNCV_3325901 [Trichonephila clavipes]|nr:hypothetical protein TNCV_3325901 [Trichonephila clavipes]